MRFVYLHLDFQPSFEKVIKTIADKTKFNETKLHANGLNKKYENFRPSVSDKIRISIKVILNDRKYKVTLYSMKRDDAIQS